ncbi:MAG: type II secretion system protein M [Gammaproteobacteria bacterium]|nr:MAG: type II secretion system protein M [Gammaproteobacteria bacterium]
MDKLLNSLSQFNRREQMTLLIGALLIVFYIIWLAVLSPLNNKRDSLLKTTESNQQTLGKVQLLAKQYEILSKQSSQVNASGDISGLIDSSLRDNGMTMGSFTPGTGGEARVRVDKVASETLMQWLYDLETKYHIVIRELSITAANDPGQVSVNVRLAKP